MGLLVSLILIAVGGVLAFAVNQSSDAQVNVHVVGWILMGVGLVGLLLAIAWWERWGPLRRSPTSVAERVPVAATPRP